MFSKEDKILLESSSFPNGTSMPIFWDHSDIVNPQKGKAIVMGVNVNFSVQRVDELGDLLHGFTIPQHRPTKSSAEIVHVHNLKNHHPADY